MPTPLKALATSFASSAACPVRPSSLLLRALSQHAPAELALDPVAGRDALLRRLRERLERGPTRIMVLRVDRLDTITHIAGEPMARRVRSTILARLALFAQPGAVIAELSGSLFALMPPAGTDSPGDLASRASAALSQPVLAGMCAFFVRVEAGVFELDGRSGDAASQLDAALSHELATRG